MADSNNIDIKFKTTADTKGAKETEKVLQEVSKSAEKLNEIEAGVQTSNTLQRVQMLERLAQGLGAVKNFIGELKEATKASDKDLSKTLGGVEKSVTAIQGAVSGAGYGYAIGGPYGALIGAAGGGALSIVTGELNAAYVSWKKLQDSTALNNNLPKILEAAKKAFNMKASAETWRELESQIEATLRQADNASKLRGLAGDARVIFADILAKFAPQLGIDPAKAAQTATDTKQQDAADDIARALADAFNRFAETQTAFNAKQNQIDNRAAAGGTAEELEKLKEEARQLGEAMKQAREAYETAKEAAKIQGGDDGFGGVTGAQNASANAGAAQDSATAALGDLANAAENNPRVAEAVSGIKAIIEDGVLSAEELKQLPALFAKYEAAIRGTGDRTVTILTTAIDKVDGYDRRLRDLETRVKEMPN